MAKKIRNGQQSKIISQAKKKLSIIGSHQQDVENEEKMGRNNQYQRK